MRQVGFPTRDVGAIPGEVRMSRYVCRFSCGAASAVATKLTLAAQAAESVEIFNAFIREEHADNRRFLADCERWFGRSITVLRNEKYDASTHEVWKQRRYMKNRFGAPCSAELKRKVLAIVARPGDVIVMGYTAEEQDRFDNLREMFPAETFEAPLIVANLGKADCLAMIERAGIELPEMYRLGYHNANCIGCIKGGEGYWNKIRSDFPQQFIQISEIQEAIGPGAYLFRDRKTGERYGLKDLPLGAGRYEDEPEISCSFFCQMAEQDIAQ